MYVVDELALGGIYPSAQIASGLMGEGVRYTRPLLHSPLTVDLIHCLLLNPPQPRISAPSPTRLPFEPDVEKVSSRVHIQTYASLNVAETVERNGRFIR